MNISRTGMVGLVIVLAVVLQVAVFNLFAVNGVVPEPGADRRGGRRHRARTAVRCRGRLHSPASCSTSRRPADHVAGRWALALVLVAILAGRVRDDARRSPIAGARDGGGVLVRRHLGVRPQRRRPR